MLGFRDTGQFVKGQCTFQIYIVYGVKFSNCSDWNENGLKLLRSFYCSTGLPFACHSNPNMSIRDMLTRYYGNHINLQFVFSPNQRLLHSHHNVLMMLFIKVVIIICIFV